MKTKLMVRANQYRKAGSLIKALQMYKRLAKGTDHEDHDAGLYMQAFIYVLQAHRCNSPLQGLGCDLRHNLEDPLVSAGQCLDEVSDDFDPKHFGLPLLQPYELAEIKRHSLPKQTH